jgi:uncharacterized membrane protein
MTCRYKLALALLVTASLLAILPSIYAQTTYDVVLLPAKLGDVTIGDASLNNRGSVIANNGNYPNVKAYLWKKGNLIALPSLGGTCSLAYGLGDLDHVVGRSCRLGDPLYHAAVWKNGQVTDLDTFGAVTSAATRINRFDDIAAYFTGLDGKVRAYLWKNNTWTALGWLGGSVTFPLALNETGAVAGQSDISNIPDPRFQLPPVHAFVWQAGTMTDFGAIFGSDFNSAYDIDSAGRVLGSADLAGDQAAHGFLWNNGVVKDLLPLPGDVVSWGDSMNRLGQIVGISGQLDPEPLDGPPFENMACPCRAVMWENDQVVDLNSRVAPKWDLDLATSINDKGEILAHTMKPFSAPVLLVPTSQSERNGLNAPRTPDSQPRVLRRNKDGSITEQR